VVPAEGGGAEEPEAAGASSGRAAEQREEQQRAADAAPPAAAAAAAVHLRSTVAEQRLEQPTDAAGDAADVDAEAPPSLAAALPVPLLEEVLRHVDCGSLCRAACTCRALSKVRVELGGEAREGGSGLY